MYLIHPHNQKFILFVNFQAFLKGDYNKAHFKETEKMPSEHKNNCNSKGKTEEWRK